MPKDEGGADDLVERAAGGLQNRRHVPQTLACLFLDGGAGKVTGGGIDHRPGPRRRPARQPSQPGCTRARSEPRWCSHSLWACPLLRECRRRVPAVQSCASARTPWQLGMTSPPRAAVGLAPPMGAHRVVRTMCAPRARRPRPRPNGPALPAIRRARTEPPPARTGCRARGTPQPLSRIPPRRHRCRRGAPTGGRPDVHMAAELRTHHPGSRLANRRQHRRRGIELTELQSGSNSMGDEAFDAQVGQAQLWNCFEELLRQCECLSRSAFGVEEFDLGRAHTDANLGVVGIGTRLRRVEHPACGVHVAAPEVDRNQSRWCGRPPIGGLRAPRQSVPPRRNGRPRPSGRAPRAVW